MLLDNRETLLVTLDSWRLSGVHLLAPWGLQDTTEICVVSIGLGVDTEEKECVAVSADSLEGAVTHYSRHNENGVSSQPHHSKEADKDDETEAICT